MAVTEGSVHMDWIKVEYERDMINYETRQKVTECQFVDNTELLHFNHFGFLQQT